ncbi:MAG: DUF4291 domain-containing protein [Nannocystaceae bacterium]
MKIARAPYLQQQPLWPTQGRHILAHYDAESVTVYQAYRPSIGNYAVEHQHFGGEWSYGRMSWIKPNFLWMMYRCGWGQKPGQEVVLAIRIARRGFDEILAQAVHSSFDPEVYASHAAWKQRVANSDVRLQWDPDHDPKGQKVPRRAIQLGLRGEVLKAFAQQWCIGIQDLSAWVREQHRHVVANRLTQLETPVERVYPVADRNVATHLGLASP